MGVSMMDGRVISIMLIVCIKRLIAVGMALRVGVIPVPERSVCNFHDQLQSSLSFCIVVEQNPHSCAGTDSGGTPLRNKCRFVSHFIGMVLRDVVIRNWQGLYSSLVTKFHSSLSF